MKTLGKTKMNKLKLFVTSILLLLLHLSAFSQQTLKSDSLWYLDADGDGYGKPSSTTASFYKPSGYVNNNLDGEDGIVNSTKWYQVGTAGFNGQNASWQSCSVGGRGTAFAAYVDPGASTANSITVYKKANVDSDWSLLSTRGFNATASTYCAIAADSKDTAWLAVVTSTTLKIYKYNGTSWSQAGANITVTASTPVDIQIGKNDTPFVCYVVSRRPNVVKFRKNLQTWGGTGSQTMVGNGAVLASNNDPTFVSLAFDKAGVVYCAFTHSSVATAGQARVYKVDLDNVGWILQGSGEATLGTGTSTSADSIKLAIDTSTSGTPNLYLFYHDNNASSKATVRKWNGSAWSTVGTAGFSSGAVSKGGIGIKRQTNEIYVAYADGGASNKAVLRKWDGVSAWAAVLDSSSLTGTARSVDLSMTNDIPYIFYKDASNAEEISSKRVGPCPTWTGAVNTLWTAKGNWYDGTVPASGEDVVIMQSATSAPASPSGTTTVKAMKVGSGSTISIASGNTFQVSDSLIVNGTVTGTGKIQLNGSSAQPIKGTGTVANLELNNSSGATIASGSTITVTDTYTPTSGTLTTNGGLTLKSDASGTARIAQGSGSSYISGNVTVQRYTPGGRRAYRYFSHPFSSDIALSNLTDNIDITGPGGSTNGFTNTSTNNPSAQWYDPTTGTGATATVDPGWTYFTSANATSGSNAWKRYQGVKVLVRGAKGEGLTTTNYTPSAATLDEAGAINMGDQVVTLTKGTNSGYNLIGNPFPCQINLNLTTRGSNVGDHYWVWDPNGGTKGTYVASPLGVPFDSSFIIPAYSAFFVYVSANTNNTITFPESCKVSSTAQSLFKSTASAIPQIIEIKIKDSTATWDKLMLIVDSNSTMAADEHDARKFLNSEMNFFTYGGGNDTLSIDRRPYKDGQVIPLCVWSFVQRPMFFEVSRLKMPQNTYLFLDDSLTGTSTLLGEGDKYYFNATLNSGDPLSVNRFKLRFYGNPNATTTHGTGIGNVTRLNASLSPNPATDEVVVKMDADAAGTTAVRIFNMQGQQVYQNEFGVMQSGSLQIPVKQFAAGVYMVNVSCGNAVFNKQLVKQ